MNCASKVIQKNLTFGMWFTIQGIFYYGLWEEKSRREFNVIISRSVILFILLQKFILDKIYILYYIDANKTKGGQICLISFLIIN